MSSPLCLLFDAERVYVLPRDGARLASSVPWQPDTPTTMVEALRAEFGAPTSLVLIVGLAFLEIAQPSLPPVPNDVRIRMLQRDSDRYFAVGERAAVATDGAVAFAMPGAQLTAWVDALSAWSPVRAVVTVAEAAALAGHEGRWAVSAGPTASGQLTIRDGRVQDARRTRRDAVGAARAQGTKRDSERDTERELTITELAGGAWRASAAPPDLQLLDAPLRERVQQQRSRRWWRSAAIAATALLLLGWSADRWRERQLSALQAEAQTLERATAGARDAQGRLLRSREEQEAIVAAERRAAAPDAPPTVLARLGTLLPRDAFMQKLDWNGAEWRIDGSTSDAAALVPLLDADSQFIDVRTAAPSTRYIENGRPRSSFSIVFRTGTAPSGAQESR